MTRAWSVKLARTGDEAAEAHHAADTVEIAAGRYLEMREHVDETALGGALPVFHGDVVAEFPLHRHFAIDRRQLAGDHHQTAGDDIGHIGGDRWHRLRQGDAEFRQFSFDQSGHRSLRQGCGRMLSLLRVAREGGGAKPPNGPVDDANEVSTAASSTRYLGNEAKLARRVQTHSA